MLTLDLSASQAEATRFAAEVRAVRSAVHAQATQASRANHALTARCGQTLRHSAELLATAHDLHHASQILLAAAHAQQARRRGEPLLAPAWFALVGMVDGQVVRALFDRGQLSCDQPLEARAWLLVDLGEQFVAEDPPRAFRASLQAPPVAVALTLLRACDLVLRFELDIG